MSVIPIDEAEAAVVETCRSILNGAGWQVRVAPQLPPVAAAIDPVRGQWNSFVLLKALLPLEGASDRVLGITRHDLFIPMLTFVFGQAQFDGRASLVSTARLHQSFYGLPESSDLLASRLGKEVLHELGHTLGLIHCERPTCVMSLANTIEHVDAKSENYCSECAAHAAARLQMREKIA